MPLSITARFQFRLLASHIAAVLGGAAAMPALLAGGLEMRNLVLAWIAGAALFLVVALVGGFIWRRSIPARPLRWALAAPPVLMATIYLGLRALSGFEPDEARATFEISFVSGICAVFSSAFFMLWTAIAPPDGARE